MFGVHFAYKVTSSFTAAVKSYSLPEVSALVYHPANAYPTRSGFSGRTADFPVCTCCAAISLPPWTSKVTVFASVHCAYNVIGALTVVAKSYSCSPATSVVHFENT